jgi:hypothetical protein
MLTREACHLLRIEIFVGLSLLEERQLRLIGWAKQVECTPPYRSQVN